MVEISNDVPLPFVVENGARRRCKYPYRELEVGQSFRLDTKGAPNLVYWAAITGFKYAQKSMTDDDGIRHIRVWRIA